MCVESNPGVDARPVRHPPRCQSWRRRPPSQSEALSRFLLLSLSPWLSHCKFSTLSLSMLLLCQRLTLESNRNMDLDPASIARYVCMSCQAQSSGHVKSSPFTRLLPTTGLEVQRAISMAAPSAWLASNPNRRQGHRGLWCSRDMGAPKSSSGRC
jgi:hypothetical protein